MNRRDFFKVLGLGLLALFLPSVGERKMELGKLWVKIAQNKPLTPEEVSFLENEGRNTQLRNSFVAENTTPNNKLDIIFPINIIFSETFAKDTTTFTVQIPSLYRHLFIIGSGRTTDITGSQYVDIVFNSDTGANYSKELMQRADVTQSGSQVLNRNSAPLGFFLDDNSTANEVGSFFTVITDYRSNAFKSVLTIGNYRNASFRYALEQTAFWDSVSPIEDITFTSSAGDFKQGSTISIYGLL